MARALAGSNGEEKLRAHETLGRARLAALTVSAPLRAKVGKSKSLHAA